MKIARESLVIACIGLADLLTTILFIRHHGASEANPLFQLYWEMGIVTFIFAKAICTLGPLLVLEWARRRNPRFVQKALRGAIIGYIVMYGIGVSRLNSPRAHAEDAASLANEHGMQMYAESTRRAEERVLLTSQGLPRVPRPIPVALNPSGSVAYAVPSQFLAPDRTPELAVRR